jgi:hypothetical protein
MYDKIVRLFPRQWADRLIGNRKFPFGFATLLNSAAWLAPGLKWMETALTPRSLIDPLDIDELE